MTLAVCATPIGNLEDVTLRVLAELRDADLVLAEDTRRTRILLDRHAIDARLLSFHEHNEEARVAELVPRLVAGERFALVADAGMPGISDPGTRLVRAAIEAGVEVHVLPGPSAVETALVASGLGGGGYTFIGFLPRRPAEREALWRSLEGTALPVVAFESAQRLPSALRSLAEVDPGRPVAVARELTKRFEEVLRGTASELAARFSEPPKGEIVLVVGGSERRGEAAVDDALAAVSRLVEGGTPRRLAADVVSALTGVARNSLYRGSL